MHYINLKFIDLTSLNHTVVRHQYLIDSLLLIIFETETMIDMQYHVIAWKDDLKAVIATRRKEGIFEIAHPSRMPTEPPTLLNNI